MTPSPAPSPGRGAALRRAAGALGALVALAVLADLGLGIGTPLATAVEHALTQAVLWPFLLVNAVGLVPHSAPGVLAAAGVLTGVGWFAARSADAGDRAGAWALDGLLGVPAVLVAVASVASGLVAAPAVVVGCLAAAAFGAVAASSGHEVPASDAGSGLASGRPRAAVLGALGLSIAGAAALLTPGPGTRDWLAALPSAGLPWVGCALALGVLLASAPPSTPRSRAGAPLGRLAAAAGFGVAVTSTFVGWSAPDGEGLVRVVAALPMPIVTAALATSLVGWGVRPWPGPARRVLPWALRLAVPAVAGAMGLLHTVSVGLTGCGVVRAQAAVEVLSLEPGAVALTPLAGGGVAVAFPDRIALLGTQAEAQITLASLAEQAALPPGAWRARVLGSEPGGRLHVWAVGEGVARFVLEPDGVLVSGALAPEACAPGSWLWDEAEARGVVGCEWEGEVMVESADGIRRLAVVGAGELSELVPSPLGGRWFAVSRRSSPFLTRIDPLRLQTTDRLFVGSGHAGLGADTATATLAVPRFVAGQVLFVHAGSLERLGAVRAGWGPGPVLRSRWGWLVASADGALRAFDPDDGEVGRVRVGLVRDLALRDPRTLVTAGTCGVLTVDVPGLLDAER